MNVIKTFISMKLKSVFSSRNGKRFHVEMDSL